MDLESSFNSDRVFFQVVGIPNEPVIKFRIPGDIPISNILEKIPVETNRPLWSIWEEHYMPITYVWEGVTIDGTRTPFQYKMKTGESNVNTLQVVYPVACPARFETTPSMIRRGQLHNSKGGTINLTHFECHERMVKCSRKCNSENLKHIPYAFENKETLADSKPRMQDNSTTVRTTNTENREKNKIQNPMSNTSADIHRVQAAISHFIKSQDVVANTTTSSKIEVSESQHHKVKKEKNPSFKWESQEKIVHAKQDTNYDLYHEIEERDQIIHKQQLLIQNMRQELDYVTVLSSIKQQKDVTNTRVEDISTICRAKGRYKGQNNDIEYSKEGTPITDNISRSISVPHTFSIYSISESSIDRGVNCESSKLNNNTLIKSSRTAKIGSTNSVNTSMVDKRSLDESTRTVPNHQHMTMDVEQLKEGNPITDNASRSISVPHTVTSRSISRLIHQDVNCESGTHTPINSSRAAKIGSTNSVNTSMEDKRSLDESTQATPTQQHITVGTEYPKEGTPTTDNASCSMSGPHTVTSRSISGSIHQDGNCESGTHTPINSSRAAKIGSTNSVNKGMVGRRSLEKSTQATPTQQHITIDTEYPKEGNPTTDNVSRSMSGPHGGALCSNSTAIAPFSESCYDTPIGRSLYASQVSPGALHAKLRAMKFENAILLEANASLTHELLFREGRQVQLGRKLDDTQEKIERARRQNEVLKAELDDHSMVLHGNLDYKTQHSVVSRENDSSYIQSRSHQSTFPADHPSEIGNIGQKKRGDYKENMAYVYNTPVEYNSCCASMPSPPVINTSLSHIHYKGDHVASVRKSQKK